MIKDDVILKAFLHGATIDSLWIITGQDIEAAIRRELLKIGQENGAGAAAKSEERARKRPLKMASRKRRERAQGAAKQQQGVNETFTDLLLTTIQSLGEPTLADLHAELEASGVSKSKDCISATLTYLRQAGRVERIGDGHTGRWRIAR